MGEPIPVRVLTLTQPWASLVALGAKQIETRSWSTGYRGPLAIHAAKGLPPLRLGERMRLGDWEVERDGAGLLLRGAISHPYRLPVGAVVAMTVLREVRSTDSIECRPDPAERALGDYSSGRYAWYLGAVSPIRLHVPLRGSLGLGRWELPAELNASLRYPIREDTLL